MSPQQRESPLKEIQLNYFTDVEQIIPAKRRLSLGFEMASISESSSKQTKIPTPSMASKTVIGNATEQNLKRSTKIPKTFKSTEVDLQYIKKLISNHKSSTSSSSSTTLIKNTKISLPTLRSRMQHLERTYVEDISTLEETRKLLENEIKDLRSKIDNLENDILDLRRELKKTNQQISLTKAAIATQEKKFEYVEEMIMKNVQHKEKLINIQLEVISNDLQNSFNEIEVQMKQELVAAKSYKDEVNNDKILKLQRDLENSTNQLEETIARKNKVLKQEMIQLEKDLSTHLKSKTDETRKLASQYEKQQAEIEAVKERCEAMKSNNDKKTAYLSGLNSKLQTLNERMVNFESLKSDLHSKKLSVLEYSSTVKELNNQLQERFELAQQSHDIRKNNYVKQELQTKMLEKSIMEYRGKLRVILFSDVPDISCQVSKIIFKQPQMDVIENDKRAIDSYSLLVEDALLKKTDFAVVFSGSSNPEFSRNAIRSHFLALEKKARELESSDYQIKISSSSSSTVPIRVSELDCLLTSSNLASDAFTIFLTITHGSSSFVSSLSFLDISSLPLLRQGNLLREPLLPSFKQESAGPLVKQLLHMYNNTKFLNFTTVSRDIENYNSIIEVCELIHTIDSRY